MMHNPSTMSPPSTARPSYWCYNCTRLVQVSNHEIATSDGVSCPYCDGGFVEQIQPTNHENHVPTMYVFAGNSGGGRHDFDLSRILGVRHNRRNSADRSNQIIVLRRGSESEGNRNSAFELYHDDGSGSGIRRVPESVSQSLVNSGFSRLLEQLLQIDSGGFPIVGQSGNPPASKTAIDSIPTVKIEHTHHEDCAICLESFDLGIDARELPCKHLYHEDCIVPWLSQGSSCPVCRHQLPEDLNPEGSDPDGRETVGLSIWPLSSGAFEVGRFRAARGVPLVAPEIDGGDGDSNRRSGPRIGGIRRRENGFRRAFRSIGSIFRSSRGGEDWVDVGL